MLCTMASVDGFATVGIVSEGGALEARFVPDANMLCHSLTHSGVELLHAGRGVEAYAARGKTMGIPLLHPWANRLSRPGYAAGGKEVTLPPPEGRYAIDPGGLPIHGALPGLLRWELIETGAPDRISARLDWSGPVLMELFPFAHELRLDAIAGDVGLELITTLARHRRRRGPRVVRLSPVSAPARRRAARRLAGRRWARPSASCSTTG